MKTGSIIRRGKSIWRVKLDAGHDANGKRRYHVETVRGTKADAVAVLAKRIAERSEGQLIERSTLTFADYAQHWLAAIAPAKSSGKTIERYGELIRSAHCSGTRHGRNAKARRFSDRRFLCASRQGRQGRRQGGTVASDMPAHSPAARSNSRLGREGREFRTSPMAAVQTAPNVKRPDIQVLDDDELAALFASLEGKPLYMPVLLAASTGLRRGEVLGLRWSDMTPTRPRLPSLRWSSLWLGSDAQRAKDG